MTLLYYEGSSIQLTSVHTQCVQLVGYLSNIAANQEQKPQLVDLELRWPYDVTSLNLVRRFLVINTSAERQVAYLTPSGRNDQRISMAVELYLLIMPPDLCFSGIKSP